MNLARAFHAPGRRNPHPARLHALGTVLLALLLLAGCTTRPAGPKPERTRLSSHLITLPGEMIGNHLVISAPGPRNRTWRFIVDTGSSVTLLSPDFASQFASIPDAPQAPQIRVRSASGEVTVLPSITLRRFNLGDARFDNVQALLYDCADLSAHLGMKIDGVLGFPLFHDTVFTLDFPRTRLLISPAGEPSLTPGSTFTFNPTTKVPLIPVQLGDRTLLTLIDSGSDGSFNFNPIGFSPQFAAGPRPGAAVSTLTGDRLQEVGRLEETLRIGTYALPRPVVDLTDQLSSLGGGVLRHFAITFNPARGNVTFHRESTAPIIMPPKRSAGLSFNRSPAYWRVAGVVPGSSADAIGIQRGDLITRINGELVEKWNLVRYETLLRNSTEIEFSFLNGRTETTAIIAVFDLVP